MVLFSMECKNGQRIIMCDVFRSEERTKEELQLYPVSLFKRFSKDGIEDVIEKCHILKGKMTFMVKGKGVILKKISLYGYQEEKLYFGDRVTFFSDNPNWEIKKSLLTNIREALWYCVGLNLGLALKR